MMDKSIRELQRDRHQQGMRIAKEIGDNTLNDYAAFSTSNGNEVEWVSETEITIRSIGCLAGRIAFDIKREDLLYNLHCATDPAFVNGFNKKFGREVARMLMDGHDCCIHRVHVKE